MKLVRGTLEVGTIVEEIVLGFPLRAINRLNAAMNASVVKLVKTSIWTAFVTKHTNIAI
jgi:hypothetical protein